MTAEPIDEDRMPWQPDPVRQSLASYTLEDLLNLPPDAPRVELVGGVIHVVPSPTVGHQDISVLLCAWLRARAPEPLTASLAVSVARRSARRERPPGV